MLDFFKLGGISKYMYVRGTPKCSWESDPLIVFYYRPMFKPLQICHNRIRPFLSSFVSRPKQTRTVRANVAKAKVTQLHGARHAASTQQGASAA